MTIGRFAGPAALTLLALVLNGCGSAPKMNFYTLKTAPMAQVEAAPAPAPYRVSVGPVTLPEMVDRPQMVVRVGAHQVALLDQHRWAEPLTSEVPQVVAANLARSLGNAQVSVHSRHGGDPEYRVRVDIQDFESVPGDGVSLGAQWTVQRSAPSEVRTGSSAVRVAVAGPGYDALAAAHGAALARLSEEIAATIRAMEAQR